MITPEEYIQQKPKKFFMHILDLCPHILKGDYKLTAYQDDDPSLEAFEDFRRAMSEKVNLDNLTEVYEETYRRSWKWNTVKSDGGDLVVEDYIAREELCFEEWVKEEDRKPALTILMDASIPACERSGTSLKRRHEKIYRITAESESEGRPCRVIACFGVDIPEIKGDMMTAYFVIKDYDDPIFSGIWGALKNNRAGNDFANVVMDFLVGTAAVGNGVPDTIYIGDDFEEDEVIIVEAKRIKNSHRPKGWQPKKKF